MKVIHLYAQDCWHDPAYILGNREALTALRDAIDQALSETQSIVPAFVADGEGYDLCVLLQDDEVVWNALLTPYTDAPGEGPKEDKVHPHSLLVEYAKLSSQVWRQEWDFLLMG